MLAVFDPAHPGWGQVSPAQFGGDAHLDDGTAGNHAHPVGQCLGLVEVVRGEQHRGSEFAKLPDQVPELAAGLRVEAGGRLVQEQQPRPTDDAQSHIQAPLLAAGQ